MNTASALQAGRHRRINCIGMPCTAARQRVMQGGDGLTRRLLVGGALRQPIPEFRCRPKTVKIAFEQGPGAWRSHYFAGSM
jgi:hypothetical protein